MNKAFRNVGKMLSRHLQIRHLKTRHSQTKHNVSEPYERLKFLGIFECLHPLKELSSCHKLNFFNPFIFAT